MTESEIAAFLTSSSPDVDVVVASEAGGAPETAWGDSFFYYDPEGLPADRRLPFATIVTQDYPGFDTFSDLGRPGVFRLNVWVGRETFGGLFGEPGGAADHDFTALDTPLPHPTYAAQGWVSILNPGPRTTDLARTLLTEALANAVTRHTLRSPTEGR